MEEFLLSSLFQICVIVFLLINPPFFLKDTNLYYMKKIILLLLLVALMPVCNLMYAQSYVPIQGTYIGVSSTGETIEKPLLYENYISLQECSNLVAVTPSYPNMTGCTWYAFIPNLNVSLGWYGPTTKDPITNKYGPSNVTSMYFIPHLNYSWVIFDVTVKTSDGNTIHTNCKFIIRP